MTFAYVHVGHIASQPTDRNYTVQLVKDNYLYIYIGTRIYRNKNTDRKSGCFNEDPKTGEISLRILPEVDVQKLNFGNIFDSIKRRVVHFFDSSAAEIFNKIFLPLD